MDDKSRFGQPMNEKGIIDWLTTRFVYFYTEKSRDGGHGPISMICEACGWGAHRAVMANVVQDSGERE
ncbi:MAG: hypothetical protein EON48_08570 [Acetobacteraceae bacterium]|nr:MAG: hypothetical protein EON48_08570 [Acetobacteraceae bacterium]